MAKHPVFYLPRDSDYNTAAVSVWRMPDTRTWGVFTTPWGPPWKTYRKWPDAVAAAKVLYVQLQLTQELPK